MIEGRLTRDRVPTEFGARLDLRIDRLQTATGWLAVDGGVSVTVGGTRVVTRGDAWVKGRRLRMPVTLRSRRPVCQSRCSRPATRAHVARHQPARIGQERLAD